MISIRLLANSAPFIHDLILRFVTKVTRRVPHMKQARTAYPSGLVIFTLISSDCTYIKTSLQPLPR
jgi:hypothetical protein